jgi:hypothetical protein
MICKDVVSAYFNALSSNSVVAEKNHEVIWTEARPEFKLQAPADLFPLLCYRHNSGKQ